MLLSVPGEPGASWHSNDAISGLLYASLVLAQLALARRFRRDARWRPWCPWLLASAAAHHRPLKSDSQMHRAGIVGYAYRRPLQYRRKLGGSRLPGKIDRTRTHLCNCLAARLVAPRAEQNHTEAALFQP